MGKEEWSPLPFYSDEQNGGSGRSRNVTQIEYDTLSDILDDIVPFGMAEWNRIEDKNLENYRTK